MLDQRQRQGSWASNETMLPQLLAIASAYTYGVRTITQKMLPSLFTHEMCSDSEFNWFIIGSIAAKLKKTSLTLLTTGHEYICFFYWQIK